MSNEFSLTYVERLFLGALDGGRQPYRFAGSVLGAQMKPIAAVVGGFLKEAFKDHVGAPEGAPQLEKVVGPPYLLNKQ